MQNKNILKTYITTVCILGSISLVYAFLNIDIDKLNWSSVSLMLLALILSLKLTISLSPVNSHLSFSDTVIFLSFLLYGGEAAVLFAAFEVIIICIHLKYKDVYLRKITVVSNIFNTILATSITFLVWLILPYFGLEHNYAVTSVLISTLAVLAVIQTLSLSGLIAVFFVLDKNAKFWKMWKEICFTSSITQFVGAGLAGVAYKILGLNDIFAVSILICIFVFVYLSYKQMIGNINNSLSKVEKAEREKAEIAEQKALEAMEHAQELEILLEKEEQISHDLRESQRDLEYAAFYDNLTELPNRSYLIERLNLLVELGIEVSHRYFVLFLDLSRFKNINDSLGHTVGDEVLKIVALRLRRLTRDEDTISRLGGDEFAVILNDLNSIDEAEEVARKIYEKLTQPYVIAENKIFSDLHIGIAPFDSEHIKPEDVLRDADIAMHHAKEKNVGIEVFDKEIRSFYLERIKLETELRYALEREELTMNYQPLISLKDGELIGFEGLLRWYHHEMGFISPGKFIPVSEDSGLIIPITVWILKETCLQLAAWQKILPEYRNLIISVNISGKHFDDTRLVRDVKTALKLSGLPPTCLKLEITESKAMENAEHTIEVLNKLKKLGVQISIDDFGTGYSSLSYLHELPFDTLKIDRSFVMNTGDNGENSQILQTIISLTKNLKKKVIAEGIETESQLSLLNSLGCDYGQGYLFSKPLPADQLEQLLYQKTSWLPAQEFEEVPSPGETSRTDEHLPVF